MKQIIKKISSFQWFVIIYVLMTLVTVFRLDSTGLGSHLILYSILYMGASGFLDIIEYAYVSIALFLISTTLWGIAFWRLAKHKNTFFCVVVLIDAAFYIILEVSTSIFSIGKIFLTFVFCVLLLRAKKREMQRLQNNGEENTVASSISSSEP